MDRKDYLREYHLRNRDRYRLAVQERKRLDPDFHARCIAYGRAWRLANIDYVRAYDRERHWKNREERIRKWREKMEDPIFYAKERARNKKRYWDKKNDENIFLIRKCKYCGKDFYQNGDFAYCDNVCQRKFFSNKYNPGKQIEGVALELLVTEKPQPLSPPRPGNIRSDDHPWKSFYKKYGNRT